MATELIQESGDGARRTGSDMTTKHFHIFGQGISFSMSPTIHIAAFRHHDLPHTYDIRETETIEQSGHLIKDALLGGVSITMPHDHAFHKFCDKQSIHARWICAINTLVAKHVAENRTIIGDNTDWSGVYALIILYTMSNNNGPTVVLVIRAGGASRAASYVMYQADIQWIFLFNRTIANADRIARDFKDLFQRGGGPGSYEST